MQGSPVKRLRMSSAAANGDSITQPPAPTLRSALSKDMAFPWMCLSEQLPLPRFVLHMDLPLPSSEEVPDEGLGPNRGARESNLAHGNVLADPLKAIPKRVADFLLEVYISRALPFFPIFHEPWLRACHATVIHQGPTSPATETQQQPTPYDIYTISLIMAISLSTAARAKQARANDMAFKLFQHAMAHAETVFVSNFSGLQALVLLHVYALMNPAVGNVYLLASYMMQACIDQGLHREDTKDSSVVNDLERDLKRRVLWTAWELDVSCSGGFTRPVTLLPKYITTEYPSDLEDSAIRPRAIDSSGRRTKFLCGGVRGFRLIEVEVIAVMFHGQMLDPKWETLESWMDDAEERIHAWRRSIQDGALQNQDPSLSAQWEEMIVFATIAEPLVVMTLFRPCPRMKNPVTDNVLKAFDAGIEVVKGYIQQVSMGFGSAKFTFPPCHHVFSAAMIFLHAMRTCPTVLASRHSLEQMEEYMDTFPDYFTLVAERWPASAACKDDYLRLLEPVKEHYMNSMRQLHTSEEMMPFLDELDGFTYQPDMSVLPGDYLYYPTQTPNAGFGGPRSDISSEANLENSDWNWYFDFGTI